MSYNDEYYISLIGEVFDGYSVETFNGKDVFIKHLNIRDQRYIHKYYEKYKNQALAKGIESEEEVLKRLVEDDLWSEDDDIKVANLEFEVENLKKTRELAFLPSKKEAFQKTIDEKLTEIFSIKQKRSEMVGITAEAYGTSRSGDEMLRFSLFKDESCEEHLYSEDDFSELEIYEVSQLGTIVLNCSRRLSEDSIKRSVLRPFFSMYLSNCDNISDFYGKPIIELSIHQLKVAIYGKIFNSIFQYVDNIPDNIRDDPDKLMAYSDSQRNQGSNSSRSGVKSDSDASAIFGATKEDLQHVAKDGKAISLSEEMKKAGGKLDMKQMMKLAGHES